MSIIAPQRSHSHQQALSIALIQKILPMGLTLPQVEERYTSFAGLHSLTSRAFIDQTRRAAGPILGHEDTEGTGFSDPESLVVVSAVFSVFTRLFTEKLLLLEGKTLSDGGSIERTDRKNK